MFKKSLHYLVFTVLVGTFLAPSAFAVAPTTSTADVPATTEYCDVTVPERAVYDGEVVTVRRKLKVAQEEEFRVKVFVKNTGNMPWFSKESTCMGVKVSLGTDKERDHNSIFYSSKGWEAANRVKMDQVRVEPGQIASFTFYGNGPTKDAVYKEYFTPVVEGVTWIENATTSFEVIVGEPEESASDIRQKISYASRTGEVLSMIDLDGARNVHVDLSDQVMAVYLGNEMIREFRVSTGGPGHATPTGVHKIVGKQDVRIGNKQPFYIMPKFQSLSINGRGFTGFGIHALPSLGSADLRAKIRGLQSQGVPIPTSIYEDDTLWNEAVEHLGRPVSHGCVRVGPIDAQFIFDFTEVGESEVTIVN